MLVSSRYTRRALVGRVAERAARGFLGDGCTQIAGSIAYRVIFAIFPLAIVLTAVAGVVIRSTGTQDDVVDSIVRNVPLTADGREEIRSLLTGATGAVSGLGLLGLIPLAWAATGLMGAIRGGLNRAWNVSQSRPFLQGKAFDTAFLAGTFGLVALSLLLGVGTSVLQSYAADLVDEIGVDPAVVTWLVGRVAPFTLIFLAALATYRFLPARQPPLGDVWPSAAVVALTITLLQSLFGLYLTYVRDFNALYGSLGAVIAFLYFVYLAAIVFLLGAEVAAELPRARAELETASDEELDADADERPLHAKLWSAARSLAVRDEGADPAPESEQQRRNAA